MIQQGFKTAENYIQNLAALRLDYEILSPGGVETMFYADGYFNARGLRVSQGESPNIRVYVWDNLDWMMAMMIPCLKAWFTQSKQFL